METDPARLLPGTLYVICGNGHAWTRTTTPITKGGTPAWAAEWTPQVPLHPQGEQGNWEDPDLYFDRRGNFHIICA